MRQPNAWEMIDSVPVTWIELADMLVLKRDPESVRPEARALSN